MTRTGVDRERLRDELDKLGLRPGFVVLVHASLRRLRPDAGGPATVLAALRDVLGRRGTVVVPTQTTWNSTTSPAFRAATLGMTEAGLAAYLADLPAFDRLTSPATAMGVLAEFVRIQGDAVRSGHPQTSFAAVGPLAPELMARHHLDSLLGDGSPLAALYRAGAFALHLGPGYDKATAFHLGESRSSRHRRGYQCKIAAPGGAEWISFEDVAYDDSDFTRLGARFEERSGIVERATIGSADAVLYPVRAAADFAQEWVRSQR